MIYKLFNSYYYLFLNMETKIHHILYSDKNILILQQKLSHIISSLYLAYLIFRLK